MAGEYKGLYIKLGADATGLTKALERAKAEARGTDKELRKLSKALKIDPGNTAMLKRQMDVYKTKLSSARHELEALKKAESDIGRENMTDDQWSKLQADIAECEQRVEAYERAVADADRKVRASQTAVGQLGKKWQDAGERMDDALEGVRNAGDQLTQKVTVPMVAAGAASVKAAVDLDTALTDVRKTVDGTEEQYQQLKQAAMDFSETNAVSASELLSIESLGAQLGYTLDLMDSGKSQIQEFGEVVSGLDIATNMSAEQAGTELAQFFNIMQEGKENTSRFGSTIVGLGNNLATTESDISAMAMRIAGAGRSIGLSSADVLGLAGALTSLGIEAEAGGTAISTVMSEIDKSVALGDSSLRTWAATAQMSVDEFSSAWREDAAGALEAVLKGMQGNVEEGGNLAVMLDELGITSLRQTDMMKRLAGSGDLMRESIALANEEWERNDALSNEVANRNDSLAAKFEMLKNQVTNVAAEVGAPLADALLDCVDAMSPLIDAIKDGARAFSEMDEGQQRMIIGAAGAIAALGPMLSVVGRTGTAVKGVGDAMETLSKLSVRMSDGADNLGKALNGAIGSSKAGLVGIGVAAAAAVAALAYHEWKKYQEHIEKVGKASADLADLQAPLSSSMEGASTAAGNASRSFADIAKAASDALDKQAELADSFSEGWASVEATRGQVDGYVQTIESLRDQDSLTAVQQQQLADAVAAYNSATGSSLEVTDSVRGSLSLTTDELKRNTEQWERNAKAQVLQEMATEQMKAQAEAEQALAEAHAQSQGAQQRLDEAREAGIWDLTAYYQELDRCRAVENDAAAAVDSAKTKYADAAGQLAAFTSGITDFIEGNSELSAKLEASHVSIDGLSGSMAQLGYTTDDLKKLSADSWDAIVSSYDGSAESVAMAMAKMKGVTSGDFDKMWKSCNGDITKMKGAIDSYNSKKLQDKKSTAKVTGNAVDGSAKRNVGETSSSVSNMSGKTVSATVTGNAVDGTARLAIERMKAALDSMPSDKKTVVRTVYETLVKKAEKPSGQASGGFFGGVIPRNARGGMTGIVTEPTLTNVGWVGEAGAEALVKWARGTAVVPIENSRYMTPFASEIARQIGNAGDAATVYNITIDGMTFNDDPHMMSVCEQFVEAARINGIARARSGA